jgi:hypothetical protein
MYFISIIASLIDYSLAQQVLTIPEQINNAGAGCPSGSVVTFVDANSTKLTHIIDKFRPRIGPGIPKKEEYLNCTVFLNITFSNPHSRLYMNAATGLLRGYLKTDTGTQMTFKANHEWVDLSGTVCPMLERLW